MKGDTWSFRQGLMFIAPLSEAVLVIKAAAISADGGGVLSHDIK